MDTPEVTIMPQGGVTLPLKVTDGDITHVGIYPPDEPVGGSRLYMHLWNQALKVGLREGNAVETWVLEALDLIKRYDKRIHPLNISYQDAVFILVKGGKVKEGESIPFDPALKEAAHDYYWFFKHPTKYGFIFPKPETVPVLAGGFNGWWMPLEDVRRRAGEPGGPGRRVPG